VEAIVLVGGQGTRLRPLTLTTPKPMLPVAGVPFLAHQIAKLRAVGVEHVVLATAYRPEAFRSYFGDGQRLGLTVSHVSEAEPLGTGGGIRNAADALRGGPTDLVVVLNGDVLSGHDLGGQLECHRERNAVATLHLVTVDDARAFGSVPTDVNGIVTAFHEKDPNPVSNQINAGCYVLDRSVIDDIPAGRPVSIEREVFPALLGGGATLAGYLDDAYWLDVGTPQAYVQASADLVTGVAGSPAYDEPNGPALVAPGARVAPDAVLTGGSSVGVDSVVESGAVIDGSVLMRGCHVATGATITRSVIGVDASIGAGCVLTDTVVGDSADIGARNELLSGVRVWPGVIMPAVSVRFSSDV
jgi:mannose-1-phosphate guanylyltransferase